MQAAMLSSDGTTRKSSYRIPPTGSVCVTTLGKLLEGSRQIVPEQQTRLGFESSGLNMALWCVGNQDFVRRPSIAVVGTRSVSADGVSRTRRFSRELVESKIVVVSGLAKGVDTVALSTAMETIGGMVIAVIGTPIDKAYPAENKELQQRIYTNHLLVSQFPPGKPVFPSNFPERNKLMAAISDGTVIMEAGETSGTLHQAAECVRLGRWLFIAKSVLEDRSLTWPRRFESYEMFRPLVSTQDVVSALETSGR